MTELVKVPGPKGYPAQIHLRATRLVIDDFGDAVGYQYRCHMCRGWFSCSHLETHSGSTTLCTRCSSTKKAMQRRKNRVAMNEKRRAYWARVRQEDPERYARWRANGEQARQLRIKSNPQHERAKVRNYMRARRELERIDAMLEAERQGVPLPDLTALPSGSRSFGTELPVAPLVEGVLAPLIAQYGAKETAAWLDLDERQVFRWTDGESRYIRESMADHVLTRTGRLWWDVWPDRADVFEGVAA